MSKLETIIQFAKLIFGAYFAYIGWEVLKVIHFANMNGVLR